MRLREEWIPLADGVRLAANVFTPDGSPPRDGWPALLEYLPYRKDDGLFERDWDLYSSMTERGYACVKVDIRGTGRSEGRPPDREYSEREQADAEEVIRWLAGQEWCSGGVGMWGISWGGFNAIQMAMRRSTPEALRAIVAIDASDDLFHDDVHLVDGLLHVDEYEVMIDLETARSPAPDFPLDERTLDERFDAPPWKLLYLRHQRDGEFWRRASLRPRYDRLRVPSLLIGGWYDGYRDSVLRMLEHVHRIPVRAILAPHDHSFPHRGSPGAPFEHRAEALRWFDRWVRGAGTRRGERWTPFRGRGGWRTAGRWSAASNARSCRRRRVGSTPSRRWRGSARHRSTRSGTCRPVGRAATPVRACGGATSSPTSGRLTSTRSSTAARPWRRRSRSWGSRTRAWRPRRRRRWPTGSCGWRTRRRTAPSCW
jgi:putative CocE/NonD family hydrolase